MGLGRTDVSSEIRVPSPPASMTAFIVVTSKVLPHYSKIKENGQLSNKPTHLEKPSVVVSMNFNFHVT
jgi:hypothetical protein